MVVHIYYSEKFVNEDFNKFSSFSGIEKIHIRSENGNTLCIKEVDGNMVITNE